MFGTPAGAAPADRRSYAPRTEVQPGLPDEGDPYRPYPDQSSTQRQPYTDPSQHPGRGAYPGQVHVPAPPPGLEPDYGYEPEPTMPAPQRRPPGAGEGRPGRTGRRPPPRQRRPSDRDDRRERRSGGGSLPFGAGALVGVVGLACFLLGLVVLPWFEAGGQEVALSDLRTAFTLPETDPADLPGANDEEASPTGADGVPTPDEVSEAVEDEVRDAAAQAAADAIDTGKTRYLELYVERVWGFAAIAVALAVLFGALLGFRRLSGLVTVLVGAAHGAALWIVFTGDGAPNPAFGVWLGLFGLAAVLVACIIGPKR